MGYDPNQKRGGPANSGNWSAYENSHPDALMRAEADDLDMLPLNNVRPSGLESYQMKNQKEMADSLSALNSGPGGAADLFVGSIMAGHLTRGTPGSAGVAAFDSWRAQAAQLYELTEDVRYADFTRGMDRSMGTLMSEDTHILAFDADVTEQAETARTRALTKRSTVLNREHWQASLQHAESESTWRGMMVAAAALSKTDDWWGFRGQPIKSVLGE